jgi:hypothetical protein
MILSSKGVPWELALEYPDEVRHGLAIMAVEMDGFYEMNWTTGQMSKVKPKKGD